MSGTGKSSALRGLAALGFGTLDTDDAGWCLQGDAPERLWDEGRMRALLETPRQEALFVSGCVPNQGLFSAHFAHVVLLSAPLDVMRQRILARRDNPFGQSEAEWAQVVADTAEVLPLLRRHATLELDTAHLSPTQTTERLAALTSAPAFREAPTHSRSSA